MSIAIQITTSEIRYCISKNVRRRGSPKEGEIKLCRDKLETKIGGLKVEEMGIGGKCVEEQLMLEGLLKTLWESTIVEVFKNMYILENNLN